MPDREPTYDELRLVQAQTLLADAERNKLDLEARRTELDIARLERTERTILADASEHHIYRLFGSVNGASCAMAMAALDQWSREDPGCPMTIVFNSPGGSVIDGLALYDFIMELRAAGHHITTVTVGMAASMGGVLLQAGDRRIAGRNAMVLIHEVSSGTAGKMTDLEDEVAFLKRLQEKLVDILAERSTLSAKQIKAKWARKDWWLDAEDALALGFIDEIRSIPQFGAAEAAAA